MRKATKLTLILASLTLGLALLKSPLSAQEDTQNCQVIYGGQVCASSTPEIAETAGEAEILYGISSALYLSGLTSFVLAKNADKFVPKL